MGILGDSGGIGGSGIGAALSAGQEQQARDISAGMQGGRGGERRKFKIKATPPQTANTSTVLSAEQQALAAEEEAQSMAAAKRRRYMARRGL